MPKKNNGGFLITADHHCHAWLEGGEPVKGINGRIQDFLDATDFLFRYATVHEVEKIYHLGDVYHLKKNVPVDAYNLLWERYRDFMYQGDEGWTPELHFVAGNHDREDDRREVVTILPYQTFSTVHVEPEVDDKARIVYVPWLYDQSRVRTFLKDLPKKEYKMLLFHGEIDGAHVGPTDYILKSKMTDEVLGSKRFGAVFAGHLHRRQYLRGVWYPGSLVPKDFGELERDKGFLHVLPSGEVKVVEVPSPSFLVYQFGKPLGDRQIEKLVKEIPGNLVRIVTSEALDPGVVKLLEAAGPRYLNLRLARVERDVPVAPQPQSKSLDDLVGKYVEERGVPEAFAPSYRDYGIETLRKAE